MKKLIACLSLIAMFISGCQSVPQTPGGDQAGPDGQSASTPLKELTMDASYSWTPELAQQYIEQENVTQVSYSGPFYFGTFLGMDEYTKGYTKQRDERADQILKVVDQSVGYLNELDAKVREVRTIFDRYFLTIAVFAPSAKEELLQQIDQGNEYAVYNYQKLVFLNSLKDELAKMEKSAEWGFLAYTKYYLTFNLTQSYQDELAFLYGRLAGLEMISASYNLEGYKTINDQLDQEMGQRSKDIEKLIQKLAYNGALLAHEEKLLFTADHYYVQDVVTNMKAKLPELKKALADYQGGKEAIDQDVLAMLNEQIGEYEEFSKNLQAYLDSVPEEDLLKEPEFKVSGLIPVARAGFMDTAAWFGGKIVDAGVAVKDTALDYGSAGVNMAWDGTKYVVNKGAEVAVAGTKVAGKVIGTALDAASAVAKTPMDVVNGVYYGNSAKQVLSTIGSNYVGIYNNFQAGTQGHQVYSDTVKILDESDKVFAAGMEGMTKLVMGEGVTSKTVGFAAKIVSGFFTGLGKDAMTALDPNTSTADTLVGLLGVGLSCIGGSGSFLKGSQALKIAGSKVASGSSSLVKGLMAIDGAAIKGGITNFFSGGLKGAFKSLFSKQGLDAALNGTKNVLSATKNTISSSLDDAFNLLKSNGVENIPGAFKGLFEKKRMLSVFADALGIGESAGKGFAPKALSFLNNIVGSMADDKIKAWVGDAAKFMGVSTQTQEEINEEEVKSVLKAVQLEMFKQLSDQYNQDIKKLAEDYQKAKNAGTLGPWEKFLISLVGVVSPGSYQAQVQISNSTMGINTTGGGPIYFEIDENFSLTCTSTLTTKASGTMQGMAVTGAATAVANGCSGSVNPETGAFTAGGSFNSTGSSTVSGYGATQTTPANMTMAFAASGSIKGNVINGSIKVGDYSFTIVPAAYSEI